MICKFCNASIIGQARGVCNGQGIMEGWHYPACPLPPVEDPVGPDGIYTLEDLAGWLDKKYARHREEPDRIAAKAIRTFREAADAIMNVTDEAESFGIAHASIVRYTRWKAVDPPPGFPGVDGPAKVHSGFNDRSDK